MGIAKTYTHSSPTLRQPVRIMPATPAIKSKPFASWSLDENDDWKAPITYPDDDKDYYWNEDNYQADNNTGWVEIG